MRTPRDELLSEIILLLSNAYGDGGLTAEQEYHENHYNAEDILSVIWTTLEPFVIDHNGKMIFDYGMIKAVLDGVDNP
jgi:hypothetical protein